MSLNHSLTHSIVNTINSKTNQQVHHVMIKELNEILRKANSTPVVIDFFATWCGPCKAIAPHFESMAKEFKDVIFVKIDGDKNRAGLSSFNVKAFPTFQFYRNNAKVDEFSGANLNRLRATVQQLSGGGSSSSSSSSSSTSTAAPNPPRTVRPPRGFGGGRRGGFQGFGGRGGRTPPRPTPPAPARRAGYDPYGGRFSTLKSITGGGGGTAAARNAPSDKKIFSATDLGFGGRGG